MSDLVTGLFDTESAAESAVSRLKASGYGQNEITIIMKDQKAAAEVAHDSGARSLEGVGTGAAIGGTVGAVLAGLLAVGSVTIPGVGLIAAGSLAAMLAGAGAGGITGGLIGWLANAGIPHDVAPYYEHGLNSGGVVVAVAAHRGDEVHIKEMLSSDAVAYAGKNTTSYISPDYNSRFKDMPGAPIAPAVVPMSTAASINAANQPMTQSTIGYDTDQKAGYDTATTAHEASRTVNDINTDQQTADRDRAEHEREARRDMDTTGPVSGAVYAVTNAADRVVTGTENQAERAGNAAANTTDRITNP